MDKVTKKQIFVFWEIRKKYIQEYGNFKLTRYCIYDLIRRRRKFDTLSFEGKNKDLANWLNISESSVSTHIKSLKKSGLIVENDFGLELTNSDVDDYIEKVHKRSFVILDFNIRDELIKGLELNSKKFTLQHFAVLSLLFSIQVTKYRSPSNRGIKRLLLISTNTVKKALFLLKEMELINKNNKVKEEIIVEYFYDLRLQILNNGNV